MSLIERVLEAVECDEMIGFCKSCGAEHYGIEPDARNYTCSECGNLSVFGAEELMITLL